MSSCKCVCVSINELSSKRDIRPCELAAAVAALKVLLVTNSTAAHGGINPDGLSGSIWRTDSATILSRLFQIRAESGEKSASDCSAPRQDKNTPNSFEQLLFWRRVNCRFGDVFSV